MSVPVREFGVVSTLMVLSFCSADGLAKVAQRFDRKSGRLAREVATLDATAPRSPRTPRELIQYWDEFTRCSALPAYRTAARERVRDRDEAL